MTSKEAIDSIKSLLGLGKFSAEETETVETVETTEQKFEATAILEDGVTQVYVEDDFTVGSQLSVIGEDETLTPAPEGTHITQDGTVITVDAEGVITEVVPAVTEEVEVEAKKEEEVAVEASQFDAEMVLTTIAELLKDYTTAIANREEDMKAEFKSELKELNEKFEKFSNEPATKPVRNQFSAEDKPLTRIERLKRLKEFSK